MTGLKQTIALALLVTMALPTTGFAQALSASRTNISPEPVVPSAVQVSVPTTGVSVQSSSSLGTALSGVHGTSGAVLVIPSAQMKPEETAALIEDMSIMARIFEKRLTDEHLSRPGYTFIYSRSTQPFNRYFARDNRLTEAIYIEGFGSLFLSNVDFPLSPPPQVQADQPEDGTDEVWATAKDEVHNPTARRRRKQGDQRKEYDAEKVDDLQRTLTKTLKHAANIRGLRAEESVTIMIRGSEITVPVSEDESPLAAEYRRLPGELTSVQPTFLTIRAKKPDIDSFAKDELDYDQFRQRIQTLAY